jgi:hypothetical protein
MMGERYGLKVGDIVYAPYSPGQLGIITAIRTEAILDAVTVTWGTGKHKGTVTTRHAGVDRKYVDLVTETERKAKNHRKKLSEVETLIKKGQFP